MSQPRHRPAYTLDNGTVVTRRMTRAEKRRVTARCRVAKISRDQAIEQLFTPEPFVPSPLAGRRRSVGAVMNPARRHPRTVRDAPTSKLRAPLAAHNPAKPSDAILAGNGRKARGYRAALNRFRKAIGWKPTEPVQAEDEVA